MSKRSGEGWSGPSAALPSVSLACCITDLYGPVHPGDSDTVCHDDVAGASVREGGQGNFIHYWGCVITSNLLDV